MDGALILDKPAGVSSARILDPLRAALPRRHRVGHAGTLDPFATGVLLTMLGAGTRLSRLLMELPKTYEARVCFGVQTDSLDTEGLVVDRADPGATAPAGLEEAIRSFVGEIEQVPPGFSALKVDGQRAYELARAGKLPDLPPRRIRIEEIDLIESPWPEVVLRVCCGSGTYVRALARDLGRSLHLPAHLTALRRTFIGPFSASDGLVFDPDEVPDRAELEPHLLPLQVLTRAVGLEELTIPLDLATAFVRGHDIAMESPLSPPVVLRAEGTGLPLGVASASDEPGCLHPHIVFFSAQRELLK